MVNFLLDLGIFICVLFLSAITELIVMILVSINSDDSASYTVRYVVYHVIIMTIFLGWLVMR